MIKKILAIIMCLALALAVGCSGGGDRLSVDNGDEPTPEEVKPQYAVNELTGLENLAPEKANRRPVAVTVNNLSQAQAVQTGLNKADVVYETEVEGGITRLVAVFKDIESVEKVGTIRSARLAFVDLAMGHNAVYIHHGQDSFHAPALLNKVNRVVIGTNNGGVRISNGLASEHTLYGYGDGIWKTIKNQGFKTEIENPTAWQNFAKEDAPVTLDYTATTVSVPFSNSYKTTFNYDATSGKYKRFFNGTERKDYNSGESIVFKNIFVLYTTIRSYSNCSPATCKGTHKEVLLNSGSGYYFVNGTYTPIKWSKNGANNKFTFTNEDGSALTVNPGNSWVCIADGTRSQAVIG